MTIQKSRRHKQFIMLAFEGYDNINLVEKFKGDDLKVSADQQEELEDGSYYYHQIIGLDVVNLKYLSSSSHPIPLKVQHALYQQLDRRL